MNAVATPLITRTVRLGDLSVPAAGGRETFSIDTARNVHAVHLYFTSTGVASTRAEIIAEIADVRVRVGGKLIMDLTATEILDLYKYFNDDAGSFTVAGVLPLIFTPMMLPLSAESRQYALGMLSDEDPPRRNTFTIEVNAQAAAPGTVDGCEVQLETDDFPSESIG